MKVTVAVRMWFTMQKMPQSRAQSFSRSLSTIDHRERLWDNGISLNILKCFDWLLFCKQPSKKLKKKQKFKEIRLSQSPSRRPTADKKA